MSAPMETPTRALAALMQAALAIPGIASAEITTDYLYSRYQEGDIAADKLQPGASGKRFSIDTHLFRVTAPVADVVGGLDLTWEALSGASPWFVMPGTDGRPVQAMSGASIREDRKAVEGSVLMAKLPVPTRFSLGYSTEDDYRAIHGGIETEWGNADNSLVWTGGIGYSADTVEPTQGKFPTGTQSDHRNALTAYGGASLIVSKRTTVQGSISVERGSGYLSDPYKRAWIVDQAATVADQRPDERLSGALNLKLRHRYEHLNAALHVDYRYFRDDWKIDAHTVEVAWHQVIGDSWRIAPGLRWYSQSQSYFYAPFYASQRSDGLASSDYRLSPFGAISLRLDATKQIERLSLGLGGELYRADGAYALKKVSVENPGLLRYWSLQARIGYSF